MLKQQQTIKRPVSLSGIGLTYQLLNLIGAMGVLVSVIVNFNAPVFFMQVAWILIAGYGIARGLSESGKPRR